MYLRIYRKTNVKSSHQCSALLIDWNHQMKFKDVAFAIVYNFSITCVRILFALCFLAFEPFLFCCCSFSLSLSLARCGVPKWLSTIWCLFKARPVLTNAVYFTTKCCQIIWALCSRSGATHTHTHTRHLPLLIVLGDSDADTDALSFSVNIYHHLSMCWIKLLMWLCIWWFIFIFQMDAGCASVWKCEHIDLWRFIIVSEDREEKKRIEKKRIERKQNKEEKKISMKKKACLRVNGDSCKLN